MSHAAPLARSSDAGGSAAEAAAPEPHRLAGMRGALSQSAGIFAVRAGSAAIAYLTQIALARTLGGTEYGVFISVWSWLLLAGMLSSFGTGLTVQRFLADAREAGDDEALRGVLIGLRRLVLGLSVGLTALALTGLWLARDIVDEAYLVPATLVLAGLPLFALTDTQDGIARVYGWTHLALVPPYLWRPALLLGAALLALGLGAPANATTAAAAALLATSATGIAQYFLLRRRLTAKIADGPRRTARRHWLRVSLPVVMTANFSFLLLNADVLLLTMLRPAEEVGVYFAATRTASLIAFIAFAVTAATGHRFAALHAQGDAAGAARLLHLATAWTVWPSLLTAGALALLGPHVLGLFGEGFAAGYPVLLVLLAGFVLRALAGPAERLLNMAGHERVCLAVYASAALANVVLNLGLIPAYGLTGAAFATVTALALETAGLAFVLHRRLGLSVAAGWSPVRLVP